MRKVGIVIFAAALVLGLVVTNLFSFGRIVSFPSLHFGAVQGSGRIASDTRDVGSFHAVDVGGIFKVEVVVGNTPSVEVRADDNLLPLIKTYTDNGVLHIESDRRIKSSNDILVRVTTTDLDNLDVSGAANVNVAGLRGDELSVDASGASHIKVAGETSNIKIDVSGASKIDAEDLTAVDADVDASGAANVEVNVSGTLTADVSGASRVVYSGSPTSVQKKTSGAAHVSAK